MLPAPKPEETAATDAVSPNYEVQEEDVNSNMDDISVFDDLIKALDIIIEGRHITLGNPDKQVPIEHFMNFLQKHQAPEGLVKCLNILPTCVRLMTVYQTNRCLKTKRFEDFIYVRSSMGYMTGKYFVQEIPSWKILPSQREGYYNHLLEEREEDGTDPNKAADESYLKILSVLKDAVSTWIEEDPKGEEGLLPFLKRAKESRKLHDNNLLSDLDLNPLTPDESGQEIETAKVVETSEAAEQMVPSENPSETDAVERAPAKNSPLLVGEKIEHNRAVDEYERQMSFARAELKRVIYQKAKYEGILRKPRPKSRLELEEEAEEATRLMARINFMVEKPIEDEIPHPDSIKYTSEYLKLNPVLNVCAKCGDSSHTNHKCSFETILDGSKRGKASPSKYEGYEWFKPDEDSLAAQGVDGLLTCMYPYCRDRETHVVATCPYLHGRCATCRTRGHDDKIDQTIDLDGVITSLS